MQCVLAPVFFRNKQRLQNKPGKNGATVRSQIFKEHETQHRFLLFDMCQKSYLGYSDRQQGRDENERMS